MEESAGSDLSICTKVLLCGTTRPLSFLCDFCPLSLWLLSPPECAAALSRYSKGKAEAGEGLAPPHISAWLEVNSLCGPGGKKQPSKAEKVGDDIWRI